MKSFLLFSFLFVNISFVSGQGYINLEDKPFIYNYPFDSVIWKILEANRTFSTLSKKEKQFFYWVNVFRNSPVNFYNSAIKDFIHQFPDANSKDVTDLKYELLKVQSLPLLAPDNGLQKLSKEHSMDLAKRSGTISHISRNGKDFAQRIKAAGPYKCGSENIFIGSYDPLEALIILLIDFGVADKGHRVNLLDPRFRLMGVSFFELTPKKAVLVQDFSCEL